MHACAAAAGVKAKTDGSVGVIGEGGTLVQVEGSVGLAGGDDLDATSGEQGAQADVEGEVGGLFKLTAIEVSSGIVAAVGGVEEDYEAWSGWGCLGRLRRRGRRLSGAGKRQGESEEKTDRDG